MVLTIAFLYIQDTSCETQAFPDNRSIPPLGLCGGYYTNCSLCGCNLRADFEDKVDGSLKTG